MKPENSFLTRTFPSSLWCIHSNIHGIRLGRPLMNNTIDNLWEISPIFSSCPLHLALKKPKKGMQG